MDQIKLSMLGKALVFVWMCCIQGCNLSDSTKNLGSKYFYRNEGGGIKEIYHEYPDDGGFIPSTVIDFECNKEFIVAKQKPKIPQDPLYDLIIKYNKGTDRFYYWIIVKDDRKVLGPLDFEEFKNEADRYNLPLEMIIK